jgi:hypothetical protein
VIAGFINGISNRRINSNRYLYLKNINTMDIQAEKDYIKRELDKMDDIHLVDAIKSMVVFGKTRIYERNIQPMTNEAFYERNKVSRKAIEENNLITQQAAKDYFAKKHDF